VVRLVRRPGAADLAAWRVAAYAGLPLAGLALALVLVRVDWAGNRQLHTLHETVSVVLALGVGAIALVRFHSRRSDTFLLLGAAFVGTACLDAYHALATSALVAERFPGSHLAAAGPWSWLAGRIFLAVFLWVNAPLRGASAAVPRQDARLPARTVYLLAGGVTLVCLAFFTFVPLPPPYRPDFIVRRPAELIPGLFFLLAFLRHLRFGSWREWRFEHWLMLSLLFGLLAEVAFMTFAARPFDALTEAAHLAKGLSYICVMVGLLGSMYNLFRQADRSAAELARINAELQGEIDERARAEAERDRFFDISLEMLCIAGHDGYFRQLNPAWQRALGWTAAELMARPYIEFVHPDDRGVTDTEGRRLRLGGGSVDFENRYLAKDGTYRWVSWRSSVSPDGSLIYAVARDIQDQKRVEQMKNDFVSVVSHELRTPLTSIRGSLGLIAGGVGGALPEKARLLVDIAAKNSDRLVRLINDILDVEKIESGEMGFRFVPVELMPLVEAAVDGNRAYAQGYEVELRIVRAVDGVRVWGDPDRLLQVMANLLSNGAKFSPRAGVVEVAVASGRGEVRVAVTDHGRGIPADFQARIFDRFAQADSSSTRQKGGTGLGLSISRAIVERHRGRLAFASEPGVSTCFFFDLPEWGGGALAPPPEAADGVDGRPRILVCEDGRRRILHVEDDRDLQRVVAAIVGQDAEVEFALDLAAARERLAGERFDLVILDLALPDGSGLDLLPLLGSLDPSTPVLIFSAHEVDAAVADRVASVLVKSQTSNRELLEGIRTALGRAWHASPA
jgi:PAS domain S-box-containing protein